MTGQTSLAGLRAPARVSRRPSQWVGAPSSDLNLACKELASLQQQCYGLVWVAQESSVQGFVQQAAPMVHPYYLYPFYEAQLPSFSTTPSLASVQSPPSTQDFDIESVSQSTLRSTGGIDWGTVAAAQNRQENRPIRGVISDREFPICFDFAQGRCRRENCQYQHDFGAIVRHNSRERRICFDFLRGECSRGKMCRFSHDIKPLIKQWLDEAADRGICDEDVLEQSSTRGICYDFVRGRCTRGRDCPWTHNLIEIACATARNKENLTIRDINKM
ncbi:hypothetical protein BSKO_06591 [Bryopsis sp. KO-2023]|nr:hypothetical protein BSKO_06591 [Bryopsis sp. KO-2023]